MVVATNKPSKSDEKTPIKAKLSIKPSEKVELKHPVSPTSAATSLEDEVLALRVRNKILTDALKAVEESATEQLKTNFELVWFARNRNRFPNHAMSKKLDTSDEHRLEIEKLRSMDGDYHHGFHCGLLAASRMFKDHSDILHVNDHEEVTDEMRNKGLEHQEKIKESRKSFPNLSVEEIPEIY